MVIYSLWFPLDDLQTIGSAAWQRQNLALDHHGLERECAVALVGKSLDVGRVCSHVNCGKQCPQKHVPFSTQRASFSGLELAWIGFLQGAGLFWFGLFAVLVCWCMVWFDLDWCILMHFESWSKPNSFRTAARSKLGRMAGPASVARRSFSEVTTEVKQPKARAVICFILIHPT